LARSVGLSVEPDFLLVIVGEPPEMRALCDALTEWSRGRTSRITPVGCLPTAWLER